MRGEINPLGRKVCGFTLGGSGGQRPPAKAPREGPEKWKWCLKWAQMAFHERSGTYSCPVPKRDPAGNVLRVILRVRFRGLGQGSPRDRSSNESCRGRPCTSYLVTGDVPSRHAPPIYFVASHSVPERVPVSRPQPEEEWSLKRPPNLNPHLWTLLDLKPPFMV